MQPSLTQGDDARSAAPRPRSRVRAPAIKPPEVAQWRLDDALVEVAPSDRARNARNAHGPQCAGFDNTFLFFSAPATDATAEGMLQLLLAGEWTAPRNPKTPGTSGTAGKCGRATPSGSGTWRRSARARRTRGATRRYHWRFQRASTSIGRSSLDMDPNSFERGSGGYYYMDGFLHPSEINRDFEIPIDIGRAFLKS